MFNGHHVPRRIFSPSSAPDTLLWEGPVYNAEICVKFKCVFEKPIVIRQRSKFSMGYQSQMTFPSQMHRTRRVSEIPAKKVIKLMRAKIILLLKLHTRKSHFNLWGLPKPACDFVTRIWHALSNAEVAPRFNPPSEWEVLAGRKYLWDPIQRPIFSLSIRLFNYANERLFFGCGCCSPEGYVV